MIDDLSINTLNGVWKLELNDKSAKIFYKEAVVGDRFAFTARTQYVPFRFKGNSNLGLSHITIHASYSAGVVLVGNDGVIIINDLQVKRPKRSFRILTTNADAIHTQQNRAQIIIQNSYFEGMGDDAINIYNKGGYVTSINGTDINIKGQWNIKKGDVL